MELKIHSIVIISILAFALIAAIPTTPVSAIVHKGLMAGEQGEGGTTGGTGGP